MQAVLADLSISMSEFKKNLAHVLREAGSKPVAVLNHNRPAFYMVSPALFEAMLDQLADADLVGLVQERLLSKAQAVAVDIDSV